MIAFLLRRLLVIVPLLLVVSFAVFAFGHLAPGSPERTLTGGRPLDAQTVAQIRHEYRLDEPFLSQYGHWLGGVVHGDFGLSIGAQDTVASIVGPRIVPTLELAAYSFVLIVGFGLVLGVVSAMQRGRALDVGISAAVLTGSAIAAYISGVVLIGIFAVGLGWFPVFGLGDAGLDRLYHLTLPAIAMAIAATSFITRTTRASLIDVLDSDYVEAAWSRGFSRRRVILRHAIRNALVPVMTASGILFGALIAGAVLVEYTFGLNGLGELLVSSIQQRDFAVVQAIALIMATGFLLSNLVVDVLQAVVDPRVRLAGSRR